jgi:CheY-like chemotaxis protein/anti-sigma regulatory factor (Ser/Thr protein kinase)
MTTDDEGHRQDLLHAMDIAVSIMEDLLGALLNIGQLDAGQIKPRITTFQLSALLERLDVEFKHQAREKGLDFRVVPTRYAVVSDRALLERVVSNLVANAIRYTERGSILIGCRRANGRVRLEVRDSGVGISAEHLGAIFDEFFQVARKTGRRGSGGLGLGLNIAKRIADILDHRLEARSEPGRGSIFSVDLPIGDILQSDIGEPEINERVGGEFTGLSVLFLEDDDTLRDALTELLERWGIVVKAFNAFDDIAAYLDESRFRPDLIITDYRLRGGLKGTEMVASIRRQLGSTCPAIVVTADTDPNLIRSIRGEGFPVLIKPVSPPGLRVMMHNILYEPQLVRELAHHDG